MKKLIVILLILTSKAGICQSISELKDKLSLGVAFSSDFYLSPNAIYAEEHTGYTFNAFRFNSTTGLIGKIKIKSYFTAGTGIAYSNKDFSSTFFCTTCQFFIENKPKHEKLRYIEIPTFSLYQILDKKVELFIKTGLTSGFLISNSKSNYVTENMDRKHLLLSGQLGITGNIEIGKGASLSISPVYRQSLTKVLNDPTFKMRSFGFETGFAYGIK